MVTITQEQWRKTPADYKGMVDGKPHILMNVGRATISAPVEITNPFEYIFVCDVCAGDHVDSGEAGPVITSEKCAQCGNPALYTIGKNLILTTK